jgi:hypothetical protein
MDAGPAKVRRRSTAAPVPFKGRMRMTNAQLDAFKTFCAEDLLDCTLRYNFTDPDDRTTAIEVRMVKPLPSWSPVGADDWMVDISLEILP